MIARSGPERVVDLVLGPDRHEVATAPNAPQNGRLPQPVTRLLDGATFILDAPKTTPAIWGDGQTVLWAEGEPLLIAAPPGVGKTTIAGQ